MSKKDSDIWERMGIENPSDQDTNTKEDIVDTTRKQMTEKARRNRAKQVTARALDRKERVLEERRQANQDKKELSAYKKYGGWLALGVLLSAIICWAILGAYTSLEPSRVESDPEGRRLLAQKILNSTRLPGGLEPDEIFLMAFQPVIYGEELRLIDAEVQEDGKPGTARDNQFVYVHFPDEGVLQKQLMRNLLRTQNGVEFKTWTSIYALEGREPITSGRFEQGLMAVDYVTQRAVLLKEGEGDKRGIVAVCALFCPDQRTRMALILQADPNPSVSVEELSLHNTVGEESYLRTYLSYLDVCR